MLFSKTAFCEFFLSCTGLNPFTYQIELAEQICNRRNVVLRAPTGAGKTMGVIVPFLFAAAEGPARLIYALPLRTLVESVYSEITRLSDSIRSLGLPIFASGNLDDELVTMQTGERPDDPFFDRGKIIVTTYDQLLSGLLSAPYGLSDRLHNINSAAIAGGLVVFDEFHLMETSKAFLTAAGLLSMFRQLSQSIWMTATGTSPVVSLLTESLNAVSVPATVEDAEQLMYTLPSVKDVSRSFVFENSMLTPESVLSHHQRRSIVVVNTVSRAQSLFMDLSKQIKASTKNIRLILLHSKFFKTDRLTKEKELRDIFGKIERESAIVIATQVIEAGLDMTCEHLHSELCPMNALVQRAGRCARFPKQQGVVHVYPLGVDKRWWLPYGDDKGPLPTLVKTEQVLQRFQQGTLHPRTCTAWVDEVHKSDDELGIRTGVRGRMNECVASISQNSIIREPANVARFIRGENSDSLSLILSDELNLPESPADRESLSLSRRSFYRIMGENTDIGWVWKLTNDDYSWVRVETMSDIRTSYAIAVRPECAAYDSEIGLQLGQNGSVTSPEKHRTKRPGYAPYRAEDWSRHAELVADAASCRLKRDNFTTGPLSGGFLNRYGLSISAVEDAVQACALLHDLGKLQVQWQKWAELAQLSRDPNYVHATLLAHTDFDPSNPQDRFRERNLPIKRPPHAAASAYYGGAFIADMLKSCSDSSRAKLASACLAAVVSHHGGWIPGSGSLEIQPLALSWDASVRSALGFCTDPKIIHGFANRPDKLGSLQTLLVHTCGPDQLAEWWPLVAFLMRTLRLSDQRATAEGSRND